MGSAEVGRDCRLVCSWPLENQKRQRSNVATAWRPSLVTASTMSPFNGTLRETKKGAPVASCALTNVARSQEKVHSVTELGSHDAQATQPIRNKLPAHAPGKPGPSGGFPINFGLATAIVKPPTVRVVAGLECEWPLEVWSCRPKGGVREPQCASRARCRIELSRHGSVPHR